MLFPGESVQVTCDLFIDIGTLRFACMKAHVFWRFGMLVSRAPRLPPLYLPTHLTLPKIYIISPHLCLGFTFYFFSP
jgi:hypothetical protein